MKIFVFMLITSLTALIFLITLAVLTSLVRSLSSENSNLPIPGKKPAGVVLGVLKQLWFWKIFVSLLIIEGIILFYIKSSRQIIFQYPCYFTVTKGTILYVIVLLKQGTKLAKFAAIVVISIAGYGIVSEIEEKKGIDFFQEIKEWWNKPRQIAYQEYTPPTTRQIDQEDETPTPIPVQNEERLLQSPYKQQSSSFFQFTTPQKRISIVRPPPARRVFFSFGFNKRNSGPQAQRQQRFHFTIGGRGRKH